MKNPVILIFTATFFLSVATVQAQETTEDPGEMITDRPDRTEAPSVVAKGYLQIESGFFYRERRNNAYREKEWTYNTSLLRYGLLDNLELRLGTFLLQVREEINGREINRSSTGFDPLLAGVKLRIAEEEGLLPQIGFLGHLRFPFAASEQYRPDNIGADFRFAFTHTINDDSDLSYNVGAEWHDDASSPTYIYTISYDFDLTNNFGLYAEIYGELPEGESADYFWDAGVNYLVSRNFQLDAFVGSGINNSQHLWAGAGVSYRIPK